jgi:hypothetical protein
MFNKYLVYNSYSINTNLILIEKAAIYEKIYFNLLVRDSISTRILYKNNILIIDGINVKYKLFYLKKNQ